MISIIITSYNKGKYIRKALDSVLSQTYKDLQIIVVDDCSTDGSREILEEYKENIKIIKNQKNIGAGASREVGRKNATGEYITFLDADDWLDSDFYETMLDKMESNNADFVYPRLKVIDEATGSVINMMGPKAHYTDQMISGNKGDIYTIAKYYLQDLCGTLIRASLFDSRGYCPRRFVEDTPTAMYLLYKTDKVFLTSYSGYNYLQVSDSLIHTYKDYDRFFHAYHNFIWALEGIRELDPKQWKINLERARDFIEKESHQRVRDTSDYVSHDTNGWWPEIRDYYGVSERKINESKRYIESQRSKVIHLS